VLQVYHCGQEAFSPQDISTTGHPELSAGQAISGQISSQSTIPSPSLSTLQLHSKTFISVVADP